VTLGIVSHSSLVELILLNIHAHGSSSESGRVYRIDKFNVPSSARKEFIDKVHSTHELLRTLPGFIQDNVLEQIGGPGEFNFVTIVIWDSMESMEAAGKAFMAKREEIGFNPQEMFARLEIKADLANYKQIDV
jgi:heme-degrading monooxygenase HmoA